MREQTCAEDDKRIEKPPPSKTCFCPRKKQQFRDKGAVNCAPSPAGHPSFCTCFHAAYRVATTFWRFLVAKLTSSYVVDFSRRNLSSGSWKPETGSQELESRLWKLEARSQKPEARSREPGTGSRKLGAGIQDLIGPANLNCEHGDLIQIDFSIFC